MKLLSKVVVLFMLSGLNANSKPMGLDQSDKIIALGKVIKVDKEILDNGKVVLDYWYVVFKESLYYCVTNRATSLYIECYDKLPLD